MSEKHEKQHSFYSVNEKNCSRIFLKTKQNHQIAFVLEYSGEVLRVQPRPYKKRDSRNN